MFLQILVPQYNETEEVISHLLNSLVMQQDFEFSDFEVLIANDGSDTKLSESFLNEYPFSIKYYLNDHKGVSATRQFLLDLATADYVMFCDADDMFSDLLALYNIKNIISGNECEVLSGCFYEELPNNKLRVFNDKNQTIDGVFIHAKVYNRNFLISNNIRWNDKLTLNEDSYFNSIVLALASKVLRYNSPIYIWRANANSITRKSSSWRLNTYHTLIDSNIELINNFKERGMIDKVNLYVSQLLYNCYFTLSSKEWLLPLNKNNYNFLINKLSNYVKEYYIFFENTPEDTKNKIFSNYVESKQYNLKDMIPFRLWYKKLLEN